MCKLFFNKEGGRDRQREGKKTRKRQERPIPSAKQPFWKAQDNPKPEQVPSGPLVNFRSQGDGTHAPRVQSDSRTHVNSQPWGRGGGDSPALTGARRWQQTRTACRCPSRPGSGKAGEPHPWPCRSQSSLGNKEKAFQ